LSRPTLAPTPFDIIDVEWFRLPACDLGDCRLKSLVLSLALLQQFERCSNNFIRLAENPCHNLGVDELLLLWSKFDHVR
jgi:hypothetical protein